MRPKPSGSPLLTSMRRGVVHSRLKPVFWLKPRRNGQRTRVVRAYTVAAPHRLQTCFPIAQQRRPQKGQKPAAPEHMKMEKLPLPSTLASILYFEPMVPYPVWFVNTMRAPARHPRRRISLSPEGEFIRCVIEDCQGIYCTNRLRAGKRRKAETLRRSQYYELL